MVKPVHVIGGGLAGSEAAWQLASAGVPVGAARDAPAPADRGASDRRLCRARLLQLVPLGRLGKQCRRAAARGDAAGRLADHGRRRSPQAAGRRRARRRPRRLCRRGDADGSKHQAADRHRRARRSTAFRLPIGTASSWRRAPSPRRRLRSAVQSLTGEAELAFFDAIAPIVHRDSIDMSVCWLQSRYDKEGPGGGTADYINCPLDKAQYDAFIDALIAGEKTAFKEWEASTPYFEGCLPIEVMAERGRETLALRSDEAGRPHQPASSRAALRRGAAPAGQCARHACGTWSGSRPS